MFQKLSVLSFLAILIGCNDATVDTKSEGEKLMQVSRDWSKVASTGNIDSILSYWADDAIVMSPGEAPIKGKEAIRAMVEGASKMPGFNISWEPKSATISKSGDMGYLIEDAQITINDSLGHPVTEQRKSVTIWRKDADGKWKNVIDMSNAVPPTQ